MIDKRKVATLVAEFLGTGFFTMLVLSVQRSTIGVPFFVALIGGLTLMTMVFTIGEVSGAYLNPAVTLALWTARRLSTMRAALLIGFEMLGAYVGYLVYDYLVKVSSLKSMGGAFNGRTLTAEAIGAGILGMVWAAASFKKWPKNVTAPIVGVGLVVAMVVASNSGFGLVNPALALGVRAWSWTYVLGPVIGAIVGVNLYGLLFAEGNNLSFSLKSKSAAVSPSTTKTPAKRVAKKSSTAKKSKRSSK